MRNPKRRFAVGFVVDGRIVSLPLRHLTIEQADCFQKVHNRLSPDTPIVIVSHPISRNLVVRKRKAVAYA